MERWRKTTPDKEQVSFWLIREIRSAAGKSDPKKSAPRGCRISRGGLGKGEGDRSR